LSPTKIGKKRLHGLHKFLTAQEDSESAPIGSPIGEISIEGLVYHG
jgi:hypothetical protein